MERVEKDKLMERMKICIQSGIKFYSKGLNTNYGLTEPTENIVIIPVNTEWEDLEKYVNVFKKAIGKCYESKRFEND